MRVTHCWCAQVRKSMARIKHVLWEGHLKAEADKAAEKREAYLAQKAQQQAQDGQEQKS